MDNAAAVKAEPWHTFSVQARSETAIIYSTMHGKTFLQHRICIVLLSAEITPWTQFLKINVQEKAILSSVRSAPVCTTASKS